MCQKCFKSNSQLNNSFGGFHENQNSSPTSNFSLSFASSEASFHYVPDKVVQVKHIFLDLEFDLEASFFSGKAVLSLSVIQAEISSLYVDAADLTISKIVLDSKSLNFDIEANKTLVYLDEVYKSGQELSLEIFYSKKDSNKGVYFVKPTQDHPEKSYQVWTQGETEHAKYWFPCLDFTSQMSTSEIRIKTDKKYKVISNGLEIKYEVQGDAQISHWKMEKIHPSYLMAVAIGDFEKITESVTSVNGSNIELTYFAESHKAEMIKHSAGQTAQMMTFLEQKFGYPYAWGKYAQVWVDDFRFGGMENTSVTLMTDDALVDQKAKLEFSFAESVVIHELAHHWFGDLIVAKHWSHSWVKEGAVSYFEAVWWSHNYGQDEGAYYRLADLRAYFAEDANRYRRPVVTNYYGNSGELYDRHLYDKGSQMYHQIHAQLGDELFWKSISHFLHQNAHKTVETIDLIRSIEVATGKNLAWLFDQYIFRGGYPVYKVDFSWDNSSKLAKIGVTQTQAKDDQDLENLFDLDIPIALNFVKRRDSTENVESKDFKFKINQKSHTFYIPLGEKPDFISFDTGNHFIKKVTLEYGLTELKNQLKHDSDVLSRIFAVEALAKKGGLAVLDIFKEVLQSEKFWGVKVEIIQNLVDLKLNQVLGVLLENLNDNDPRVKKAVIQALSSFKTKEVFDVLLPVAKDFNQSYFVQNSALNVCGAIANSKLVENIDKEELLRIYTQILEDGSTWGEVVRIGAISGLTHFDTQESLDLLTKYTMLSIPDSLRRAAVRSLGAISKNLNQSQINQIISVLDQISKEENFYMEMAICQAAQSINSKAVIPILEHIKNHASDEHSTKLAEESIVKVMKNLGSDKSILEIKEELEKLKKTNQDLKSRLEFLEAKK